MKKLLALLLVCCSPFIFAEEGPVFEEADETEYSAFPHIPYGSFENEEAEDDETPAATLNVGEWKRYKSTFGMEKILIRFPQKPAISQSNSLYTAYAYDHAVLYSLSGYFPPIGNIDPSTWFETIISNLTLYPYRLIASTSYQASNGDWILDYTAHEYVQDLIVKARAVITPLNSYIIQCTKPSGSRDYFNYFLDNFWIKCECAE